MKTGETLSEVTAPHVPRPKLYAWETNDCTVYCLMHALNIDYDTAWRFCSMHGRIARKGFYFVQKIIPCLNVTDMSAMICGTLDYYMKAKLFKSGTYIIRSASHVFVVKNGIVYDHERAKNRSILNVWKINH